MPDPTAVAWAAGLFEGEGTLHALHGRYPRASMASADHDVIQRFTAIVEVGTLAGPITSQRFPTRRPMWRWNTTNAQDFVRFTSLVEPHLGQRRREKLKELRSTSRLADPLYLAGDRSRIALPMDEVAFRYQNGESLAKLEERFGLSAGSIAKRLKSRGLQLRRPGWPH